MEASVLTGATRAGWAGLKVNPGSTHEKKKLGSGWARPELKPDVTNPGSGWPGLGSGWPGSGRVRDGPRAKKFTFIKMCDKMSKFNQNLS